MRRPPPRLCDPPPRPDKGRAGLERLRHVPGRGGDPVPQRVPYSHHQMGAGWGVLMNAILHDPLEAARRAAVMRAEDEREGNAVCFLSNLSSLLGCGGGGSNAHSLLAAT